MSSMYVTRQPGQDRSQISMMEESKWSLPGWRIEQKYDNRVLIGNWNEEKRKFQRGNGTFNSTHRIDFSKYSNFTCDRRSRQQALLKNDGLDRKFIFTHPDICKKYSNNMISCYDQYYNGRELKESSLPKLRSWDGRTLVWAPEKSDYPLQGHPTNYGLLQKKNQKLAEASCDDEYISTYSASFNNIVKTFSMRKNFSAPAAVSSANETRLKDSKKAMHFQNSRIPTIPNYVSNKQSILA